jgi:hypothetical protein
MMAIYFEYEQVSWGADITLWRMFEATHCLLSVISSAVVCEDQMNIEAGVEVMKVC